MRCKILSLQSCVTVLVLLIAGCAGRDGLHIREPYLPGSYEPVKEGEPRYELGRQVADGQAYSSYLKSQFALMNGDLESAMRHLKTVTRRDPWAVAPKMRLAGVLLMLDRSEEAGDVLAELSLDPKQLPPELLQVYVAAVIGSGPSETARKAVLEAFRRRLLSPQQFLRWVGIEENQTDPAELLMFVEGLRQIRDEPVLDCVTGHLYMRLNRQERAAEKLEACLDTFSDWLPGMLELGMVYELLGNEASAKDLYERVLVVQPGQQLAVWRLRILALPKSERKEARDELQALLNEVRYETALQLASQALGEEDVVRAESILATLSRDMQARARTRILRGAVAEIRGNIDAALDLYRDAAETDVYEVRRVAQMQWVRALRAHREDWLGRAQKRYRQRQDSALALAIGLAIAEEDPDAGFDFLQQSVNQHPDDVELRYRLGVFHEQRGNRDAALAEMEEVIARDDQHADALNFLGYSLAEVGRDLARAETLIRAAIELKPRAGYIMDSLGWVLFQQGKAAEAVPWLEKALEFEGSDPLILEHLGDAYAVVGRDEDARAAYREALRIVEDISEAERLREKILNTRDP